jgi:hypothetical protein
MKEYFSPSVRSVEAMSDGEGRLIEQAGTHLLVLKTQVIRTERALGAFRENPGKAQRGQLMLELKALARLPSIPSIVVKGLADKE